MSEPDTYGWRFWGGVALFFGIGVAIAAYMAFEDVRNGRSPLGAIVRGAFVGGIYAYLIFFVAMNLLRLFRKPRRDSGGGFR